MKRRICGIAISLALLGSLTLTGTALAANAPLTVSATYPSLLLVNASAGAFQITINNPNSVGVTGVSVFFQTPAGLKLAVSQGSGNTCGGSLTPTLGTTVGLNNGVIAASSSCSFFVDVQGVSPGNYAFHTSVANSNETPTGTVWASFAVYADAPPVFTMSFSPTTIDQYGVSTLSLSIGNPVSNPAAYSNVTVPDTLPDGLVLNAGPTSFCGGSLIYGFPHTFTLTGVTIQPGTTCQFSVSVSGVTGGHYTDQVSAIYVSGAQANSGSAVLTVNAPATPAPATPAPSVASSRQPAATGSSVSPIEGASSPATGSSDQSPAATQSTAAPSSSGGVVAPPGQPDGGSGSILLLAVVVAAGFVGLLVVLFLRRRKPAAQ